MVVDAMWCNFKCLVLYLYNHPHVDFATYALVTQALPAYRNKLHRILDDPWKGWASFLNGEQAPIKKAWLTLHKWEIKGHYDTNVLQWTCSCGAQEYHSYLLCKHLVQALPCPDAYWWTTIVQYCTTLHPSMTYVDSFHQRIEPKHQSLRNWVAIHGLQGCKVESMTLVLLWYQLPCMLNPIYDWTHPDPLSDFLHPPNHIQWVLMASFEKAI